MFHSEIDASTSRSYYVRYGLHPRIGIFPSSRPQSIGAPVVIRTRRGTELGKVVAETEGPPASVSAAPETALILRAATGDDLDAFREADSKRHRLYDAVRVVFDEAVWPLQLIDVEPTLDVDRTVLYYLGPHRLDFAGLREALLARIGLDVAFEPVGKDEEPEPEPTGCGTCGTSGGGCGSGGGSCSACGSHP